MRLREACGEAVGVNFDPSHLMWMGADPIAAIEALGPAIFHVHAKDTRIDPRNVAAQQPAGDAAERRSARERSWNYVTLGYGHGEDFWRAFCLALRRVGYDGVAVDRARGHGDVADGGHAEVGRAAAPRLHRRAGELRAAEDLAADLRPLAGLRQLHHRRDDALIVEAEGEVREAAGAEDAGDEVVHLDHLDVEVAEAAAAVVEAAGRRGTGESASRRAAS